MAAIVAGRVPHFAFANIVQQVPWQTSSYPTSATSAMMNGLITQRKLGKSPISARKKE
jgi:hypothetical protein